MDIGNYEKILDAMQMTGVYVIREDDHRILYHNKHIQEVMPYIRPGMVCHEVWTGSCDACPLLTIGERQESRSIKFDTPFGRVVDTVASRILWEDSIPAFVITVTPHMEAASFTYHKILRANLTKDHYDIVKNIFPEDSNQPTAGCLSKWLEKFAQSGKVYEEDVERFTRFMELEHLCQALSLGRKTLTCTYRRRSQGGYRWNIMEIAPSFDYTDTNQSVMIYTRDVHDIYREGLEREDINIRSQEMIRSLGEQNYGIYMIDLHTGTVSPLREDGELHLDVRPDPLLWDAYISEHIQPHLHEAYREEFVRKFALKALRQARETGEKKTELFCQRQTANRYAYISVTAYIGEEKGKKSYAVLALQDVDERMRQEIEHMKREEEGRRAVQEKIDIIGSLSSMFSTAYYIDLQSNEYRKITQLDQVGEVLNQQTSYSTALRRYAELCVHPDDRPEYMRTLAAENLLNVLCEERPYIAVEYRWRRSNEPEADEDSLEYQWLRATAVQAQVVDGKPKTVVFVTQDVTESKRKEEQEQKALKEACEMANHANAAKSEFMSRMSHDIRTPLNGIIGMTMIAGAHLEDPNRIWDCLNKITISSNHLLSLINEVLDMSKIESGKVDLLEEPFALSDLVHNVETMLRPSVQEKKHTLRIYPLEVQQEYVLGDMMRLQQVFVNILGNSVKYTLPGGLLEMRITESESREQGYGCYEFVCSDNGIGMDEEFVKTIFEPFSRAEDSRVSKIEGTGLGMTIAQNIVRKMNGSIHVKSKPGKGSRFTVTLLLKQQKEAQAVQADTPGAWLDNISEISFEGCRILLVEDNELNREIAEEIISDMGVVVESVENGAEALKQFEERPAGYYNLIFMDIQMPVMDGYEATRAIRALKRPDAAAIPIIAMSANAFTEDMRASREAGMNEHITKPLDVDQLVSCMGRWMRRR